MLILSAHNLINTTSPSPRTDLGKAPRLWLHAEQQLHCSLICGRVYGLENSPLRSFSVQLRSSFIPGVHRKETRAALRHPGNLAGVESSRCLESGSFRPRAQMLPSVLCARREFQRQLCSSLLLKGSSTRGMLLSCWAGSVISRCPCAML